MIELTNIENHKNSNKQSQSEEKPLQVVRARKKTSVIKPKNNNNNISESAKMARVDAKIPNTVGGENKKFVRVDEIDLTPRKRLKFDDDGDKENKIDKKKLLTMSEKKPNNSGLNMRPPAIKPPKKPDDSVTRISVETLNKKIEKDESLERIEVKVEEKQSTNESTTAEKANESKLVSYARSFKCPQCNVNYSSTTHLPKIICWEQNMGMVCEPCSASLMQANEPCPFCQQHVVQPLRSGHGFMTNSVLLDMIRLVEEPAEKRRIRLNLIYEQVEKTLKNSLAQIDEYLDTEMNSADKEFISSVNDKTNETVLETLRRVKDNIGEKFKSLMKTAEEEKPRVNKSTSDEQPRNTPATNKAKRTMPFNEKPQYRHSLKPSINFELPSTDSYSEIQLKSLSKNLLSLIVLSKQTFFCIEKDNVNDQTTFFKILDENGMCGHDSVWSDKNQLTSFSNSSISNPTLYGLCFEAEFFTLSCFASKKLVKFKHRESFLPILDSHKVDMRMITSSNDEICFHQMNASGNSNYIRTFSYKGERGSKIGPLQYSDKSKPFYISQRFQLISLTPQLIYIRDDFDSSSNSIRVLDRVTGQCRFAMTINATADDRVLVDLSGRLVFLNKQRRRISVYGPKDDFKVVHEIVLDAKLTSFDTWSVTIDNELALFFSQLSTVKFFKL